MDVIDQAEEEIESYMDFAIKTASASLAKTLYPTGECHNCHETVGDKKLFCDGHCANEHERKRLRYF